MLNIIGIISGIRRRFKWYFDRKYVLKSLSKRKGQCNNCGTCCLCNTNCKYLSDNNISCKLYKIQPFFCKIFPIDPKDKEMSGKDVEEICGYYWEER